VVSVLKRDERTEGQIRRVTNAKVVVYGGQLEAPKAESKGVVLLTNADDFKSYSKGEEEQMEKTIKEIADADVKCIVVGVGIPSYLAMYYCDRYGIMVVKEASKHNLRRICRASGAAGMMRLGKPSPEEIGYCDEIVIEEVGSTNLYFFRNNSEKCKISTILIRGSTENILDNVERAVDDGVNVFKVLIKDNRLVPGAGASEIELSKRLLPLGESTPGLDQYAIKKFAEALEIIPRTLAENAGFDANALVTSLIAAHQQGNEKAGIDIEEGKVADVAELGIFDSLFAKYNAIKLATDTAITVLQVDQIIMSKTAGGPKVPQMGARDAE